MLTHKESALSNQTKFTILTQECFRRIHNTSENVDINTKVSILNEYMKDLKISGYDEKDRLNILVGGVKTYSKLKQKELSGERPFYRPPGYKISERNEKKEKKVNNWYKNKDKEYMSVMFVEATEDDKLLKMFKETEELYKIDEKHRIKFVSKSGTKLKYILVKNDPFSSECSDDMCKPCGNSKGKPSLL